VERKTSNLVIVNRNPKASTKALCHKDEEKRRKRVKLFDSMGRMKELTRGAIDQDPGEERIGNETHDPFDQIMVKAKGDKNCFDELPT